MSFSYATLPFPLQSLQAYKGSIQSKIQRFLHVLIANSQHFWIRTRARNVLFCLTKPPSHHVSWICKCFQADPRAQACTIAANCAKADNLPQKKHASNAYALQASTVPSLQQGSRAQPKYDSVTRKHYHATAVITVLSCTS